jgi:putative ABC transport system substrate-binding protein
MHFGHLRRREFIALLGGGAMAAPPLLARAQQLGRVRRVGLLLAGTLEGDGETEARLKALRERLAQLGWIEGRNLALFVRAFTGEGEQIRAYARELAGLSLDVILVVSNPVLAAMRQAAPATPIVFVQVGDPVGSGFVSSLAHPGGTITGFMHYEPAMGGKWLETLKEVSPGISRALVLLLPDVAANVEFLRAAQAAGPVQNVAVEEAGVRNTDDVLRAMTSFGDGPAAGVVALPNPVTGGNRKLIADLAIKQRLSTITAFRYVAASGALVSYGIDVLALFQSAAGYIDRILKGEKPAELPVQAPTKYELVINLKTAKALGLDVPPMLIARADEVIE